MKEKPKKASKSSKKAQEPEPPKELTPRQLKEQRREEARAKAAETRKLVTSGTNAWTGKLPAQILNEHCQKVKWERADYQVRGSNESLSAVVILGRKNMKTGATDKVRFDPPISIVPTQSTPIEARHMAATYAMHRIMSHKNMKMMLPPVHRDVWVQLDLEKAAAPAYLAWKWREDPFEAEIERKAGLKKAEEIRAQKDAAKQQADISRAVQQSLRIASPVTQESKDASPAAALEIAGPERSQHKVRLDSPLTMSKDVRARLESVLRENNGFQLSNAGSLDRSDPAYGPTTTALSKLGFEKFEIEQALETTGNLTEALMWLLVHVPEDDLPKEFMPPSLNSTARVSSSLAIENAISKIKKYGYSEQVALSAVKLTGSFATAVAYLTQSLVGVENESVVAPPEDIWQEELESLASIYADGFSALSGESCKVVTSAKLGITFYKSPNYPNSVPGILVDFPNPTKKYVILDCIRQLGEQALSQIGDFMLLTLIEWLESSLRDILNTPPRLKTLARGITGVSEPEIPGRTAPSKPTRTKRRTSRQAPDSRVLKEVHDKLFSTPDGKNMLKARASLPAWEKRAEVTSLVNGHSVVLVSGETGSGKSTQVAQFILDELIEKGQGGTANIVCTQPRRISALGLAQRVSDERLNKVGEQVGYVVRGENRISPATQLKFMTSGVLLRMMQTDPDSIQELSHVILDEIHERSLDGDFLMIMLKRLLRMSSKIKVILMSATVDPVPFKRYFQPVAGVVGYTHIPGRTFPVKKQYLNDILPWVGYVPGELADAGVKPTDLGRIITYLKDGVDYRLVAELVDSLHKDLGTENGSVLIFMAGAEEIDRTIKAISRVGSAGQLWAIPLHASLSPRDQKLVFQTAPAGKRKVVVATNVAETSITIPDIVAVIDSGRVKDALYSQESGVTRLQETWASRAAVTQRMGRAGRVRAGTVYKLYTEAIEAEKMASHAVPEILRSPLESLYLSIKAMGIANADKFLQDAMDTPDTAALDAARNTLQQLGAITTADILTPLGKHMSLVPADPQTSKLLVLSAVFGMVSTGLTLASVLTGRSPLVAPREQRDAAKIAHQSFDTKGDGDLIAALEAYNSWKVLSGKMARRELNDWCAANFVSDRICRDIDSTRRQFLGVLMRISFTGTDREEKLPPQLLENNGELPLVRAVLAASLRPKLAEISYPEKTFKSTFTGSMEVDPDARSIKFFSLNRERVFVHPSSVLFGVNKFVEEAHHLSYGSSMMSSKHFISGISPVNGYGIIFFSNKIEIDPFGAGLTIDGWTGFRCWPRIGVLVQSLKNVFDDLLARKFDAADLDLSSSGVMKMVHGLISTNGNA